MAYYRIPLLRHHKFWKEIFWTGTFWHGDFQASDFLTKGPFLYHFYITFNLKQNKKSFAFNIHASVFDWRRTLWINKFPEVQISTFDCGH